MQLSIVTQKLQTLYCAFAPDWGVVSYGACQDEAVNNLQAEVGLVRQGCNTALAASDRPFRCPVCRRGFRSHGSLERHGREHAGEGQCKTCGRQLNDKEYHRC